jgi:colanic acid biosynthesis glycosyl transferase WcaI
MHFSEQSRPRLLVVVNVFEPDLGGGVLFSDLCYGLAERGFDVTVRCAYPYYPEWRDKSGENGLRIRREKRNGVQVERFGIFIPPNPNSLPQRLLYEASFMTSLMRTLPDRRFDVVMAFCPLAGGVAYAALRKRLHREPIWLNVQDLPADAAAAGGLSGHGGANPFTRIQSALFNACDFWSTISPVMVTRLESIRKKDQSIVYLPNWLHSSLRDRIDALPNREEHTDSPVRLFYSGNIGTKQNLLGFCKGLAASEAPFRFLIRGSGSRAGEVHQWIAERNDARFEFEPLASEDAFIASLRDADLFVVPEAAGSGGSFIPSKLIPAISVGTPVLAVSDPDSPLGREVRDANLGPHFSWDRLPEVGSLVGSLGDLGHARRKWNTALEERAAFYDRDVIVDEYARLLTQLAARSSSRT